MSTKRMPCGAIAAGLVLAGAEAGAADPAFQNFFFAVCSAPTAGLLAARCAQTPGGLGDLSGDSESSLNPSQNLSHNQAPVGTAQTRGKAARERGENLRDTSDDSSPATPALTVGPFSLLVHVHGTWFDRDSGAQAYGERAIEGDSRAIEAGLDYRASDRAVLGALLGLERSDFEFDAELPGVNFTPAAFAGDGDGDNAYLTAFASFAIGGNGFLEFAGGYEQSDGTFRRNAVFQESTRTQAQTNVRTTGEADGTVTWLSANAGFDAQRGPFSFGPYAGLTRTRAELDAYTEQDTSGSGLAMSFGETTRDSLLAHAGARMSYAASAGAGVFVTQLRVEYQYEFEDEPQTVALRFALDPRATEYTLRAVRGDPAAINVGLGLSAVLPNGWMPFFEYSGLLGDQVLERHRATLGMRVEF